MCYTVKMYEWLKTILILPFNVLVMIPCIILYFSHYHFKMPSLCFAVIGILLLVMGLTIAVWTMILFNNIGKGTAAPWNPPKKLVVEGPYCYVRNPMITSVLLILLGEYFLLNAVQIIWWLLLFFLINNIYFSLFEEKQLENRFGDKYKEYKKNVPRWIPRLTRGKQ